MGEQVDARLPWGCSSVGRAPALQAGGQEFESLHLHSSKDVPIDLTVMIACKSLCVMMTGKTVGRKRERKSNLYLENRILKYEKSNIKKSID